VGGSLLTLSILKDPARGIPVSSSSGNDCDGKLEFQMGPKTVDAVTSDRAYSIPVLPSVESDESDVEHL